LALKCPAPNSTYRVYLMENVLRRVFNPQYNMWTES